MGLREHLVRSCLIAYRSDGAHMALPRLLHESQQPRQRRRLGKRTGPRRLTTSGPRAMADASASS